MVQPGMLPQGHFLHFWMIDSGERACSPFIARVNLRRRTDFPSLKESLVGKRCCVTNPLSDGVVEEAVIDWIANRYCNGIVGVIQRMRREAGLKTKAD